SEIVEACRNNDLAGALANFDPASIVDRPDLFLDRDAFGPERVALRLAIVRHRLPGANDRRVAGAAAEVALQCLFDGTAGRLWIAHPQAVEAHHEARRAEA